MARFRSRASRALALAAGLLVILGLGYFAVASLRSDDQKGLLADLISQALSTPTSEISIGAIDGLLSSDATMRDLKISDRDGVWLSVDRIHIVWRRLALLQRRLDIDKLDISEMKLARMAIPAEAPVSDNRRPIFPELPLRIEIKQFSLARINFGKPVLGVASSFSTGGHARLGPPSEGLLLVLDAQRLDRPETLSVRLNLVPESQRLDLSVNLDEPAGGILSDLGNIPGRPPIKLSLGGGGALDAFNAKLTFDAGQGVWARGDASLDRQGAGRKLDLDLAAEVSGLLPEIAAPVFAGTTRLTGNVFFDDDGTLKIPGIDLTAAAARLNITGGLSATQTADIRISARNVPNAESHTALRDAKIGRLALDAHITGHLDSPTIDSTLAVEDARLPSIAFSRLDASFKAAPNGSIINASTLLRLVADAKATGLSLTNPALAQTIGSEASFAMRGVSTVKGPVDFQTLEIKSQTLTARFKGRAGAAELKGRLDVAAPDLARFGKVAGLGLKGEATLTGDIEGTPSSDRFTAKVDAIANRFGTGVASIDGLYGGTITLSGGARLDPDGGFGFNDLQLLGPNASARIDGAVTPKLADMTASMTIPELSKADKRASGRGEIAAHVTGTLSRPDATAKISIRNATMLGRPVPRLDLQADATNLTGALDARVSLDGEIDRKSARGFLHIARPTGGGVILDGVDASIGSVSAHGGVAFDATNLASGQFAIHGDDLDDLSPLLLQKLSGGIDANVTLANTDARQDAAIKANGLRIDAFGVSLANFTSDFALVNIYQHPQIQGSLAVDEARIGGETVSHIQLNAKGGVDASDIALTAAARGFDLNSRARLIPADPVRIEVAKFDAMRGGNIIHLTAPATVVIKDGGADLRNLSVSLGGGRLTIEGRVGSKLDLKAIARAVPLSAADIAAPNLGLTGSLDGEATIAGAPTSASGAYRFKISKFMAPQTRRAGLPPIDVDATGRFEGEKTTLEASLAIGQAGTLRISGSAPFAPTGALDLAIKGNLDAGVANQSLSAATRRVTGSVAVDARLGGTLETPHASGSMALSNGSFRDPMLGIRLDAIRAHLVAQNDKVTIESASAITRNGGSITADGLIRLDPAGGFPGDIRVQSRNAELVQTALETAILGLDVDISGSLMRAPRVGGRVEILSLDISIPDRLMSSLQPMPGTRHISPTSTVAARLAIAAKVRRGRGAPSFNPAIDLTVHAPGKIRVHGRGLDVQLSGNLKLTGTLAQPKPVGAFNLVQGRLQVLTSQLDFTRANLTFAGDISPQLDFLATTQAGNATLSIAITGDPADPQFIFTSSPDLPQEEILSRILFGTSSGQLSPTQALALAQAITIYSGGNSALEGFRRSLGLGDSKRSNNSLTNFLGDRVNLGVHTGATPAQTGIGVNINIYNQLKAKGAIDATGGASMGVGAEYEW